VTIRALLCLSLLIAAAAAGHADSQVLATGATLDVKIDSPNAIVSSAVGPKVTGALVITPSPLKPVCDHIVFYVDEKARLTSTEPSPRLELDTAALSDGEHTLRLEAETNGKLTYSSGTIRFQVANKAGAAVAGAFDRVAEEQPAPAYEKTYRAVIGQEAIWFNGTEGDLERHAFISNGRMYITLNDLMRHIGGRIVWGPKGNSIDVTRNDKTIHLTPGSSKATVNSNPVDLRLPVTVHDGRTFVPARALCDLFGVYIEYNKTEHRAYVATPQPTYAIEARAYPWVTTAGGYRTVFSAEPGHVGFKNHSGLPIHILFQGNGYRTDIQVPGLTEITPVAIPPGTYRVTIWSRQGEDMETYLTTTSGVIDIYEVYIGRPLGHRPND
jgi:hypothetical protein